MDKVTVRALARYYLGDIATARRNARPQRDGEQFAYSVGLSEIIADILKDVEPLRPFIGPGRAGPELRGVADELEAVLQQIIRGAA